MTPFQLHIYICEVEMQCEFCLAAADSVDEYFNGRGEIPTTKPEKAAGSDTELVQAQLFRSIHGFLTHAAIVSRLLWPGTPKQRRGEDATSHDRRKAQAVNRGEQLRFALGIQGEQPSGQRTLRDHFEHFDERLDDWVLTSNRHTFVDHRLGPPNRMFGPEQSDVIRWFDQTDGSFYFRGERFDLKVLATWVSEIRGLAAQARRYGPRTPPAS